MNKNFMNRLTMLAVTLMASMACFAQGKFVTTIGANHATGDEFDYLELKYKVLDNSKGYTVEIIGFSDSFEANPNLFDTSEDITHFNTVSIPHFIGTSDNVAVTTYVQSIAAGALIPTNTNLAAKVTAMTIDYIDNTTTNGDPIIIGENAFSALTSLATVESLIPGAKLAAISDNTFATSVYKNATLTVPNEKMGKYSQVAGWKNFYKIQNSAGHLLGNMNTDTRLTTADYRSEERRVGKEC